MCVGKGGGGMFQNERVEVREGGRVVWCGLGPTSAMVAAVSLHRGTAAARCIKSRNYPINSCVLGVGTGEF